MLSYSSAQEKSENCSVPSPLGQWYQYIKHVHVKLIILITK